MDVSQAFDKFNRKGLLTKTLFKPYLKNRLFRVKYEDEYSQLREIQAEVPQGSIMGPLLYVLYTSDKPEVAGMAMTILADDTAIFSVARTENEAKCNLQNALTSVLEWTRKLCQNMLTLLINQLCCTNTVCKYGKISWYDSGCEISL